MKARLKRAEKLKDACRVIKLAIEEDDREEPAALKLQRQYKSFKLRNHIKRAIEERHKRRKNAVSMI